MFFVHELAHHLLHIKGFTPEYFKNKGTSQSEYEAITWSVAAKIHNNRYIWNIKLVFKSVKSYTTKKGDACWRISYFENLPLRFVFEPGEYNGSHRRCCGLCKKMWIHNLTKRFNKRIE
jgi:hypothetical protein